MRKKKPSLGKALLDVFPQPPDSFSYSQKLWHKVVKTALAWESECQILVLTLPPHHHGPQVSTLGKESKLKPCWMVQGSAKSSSSGGRHTGTPLPAVPAATCVNWVESLFSDPQFLGLGNGAELQVLLPRVAQTISFFFFFYSFNFQFLFFLNFILFIFLYSRFLLVIHSIHISVDMSIPISQFITPPPPPPRRFPPLGVHTFVLYICVSISALQTGSSVPFF